MAATVLTVLDGVNFAPALSVLYGVMAAGIAFFIAVGAGVMVLKTVRQVMGLPPMEFKTSSSRAGRGGKQIAKREVAVSDWRKPCTSTSCKEAINFFSDSKKRDDRYRQQDSRAVYEYHKRENARFGIEI